MPALSTPIPADGWGPRAALPLLIHPPQLRRAREDHGLFGPGSPAWELWGSLPIVLIAAVRAAVVQMFQPATGAGVHQNSVYQNDPFGRLRRTGDYFLTVVFGDGREAVEASDRLQRVHSRVSGTEPVTGRPYSALDPENQLWVHLTAWHSVLYCHERYGTGKLTTEREARYWQECAIASELQGLDATTTPATRDAVRGYFASMRPQLCLSEGAMDTIAWLRAPRTLTPAQKPLELPLRILSRAGIATLPRHIRQLGGFDHPTLTTAAYATLAKAEVRLLDLPMTERVFVAASPEGYAVRHAALHGPPPRNPRTVTPTEIRNRPPATASSHSQAA